MQLVHVVPTEMTTAHSLLIRQAERLATQGVPSLVKSWASVTLTTPIL